MTDSLLVKDSTVTICPKHALCDTAHSLPMVVLELILIDILFAINSSWFQYNSLV